MGVSGNPLTSNYRLFAETHVPDMYILNIHLIWQMRVTSLKSLQCVALPEAMYC